MIWPMALWPGHSVRAMVSLITITGSLAGTSLSEISRPSISEMPMAFR